MALEEVRTPLALLHPLTVVERVEERKKTLVINVVVVVVVKSLSGRV